MKNRAGLLPYRINNGKIEYLFMRPSNPQYGGPHLQIAKGKIEQFEEPVDAAVREACEELGITKDSFFPQTLSLIWEDKYSNGLFCKIWMARLKDNIILQQPCYETGEIAYLTLENFLLYGRDIHHKIVIKADKFLNQQYVKF